MRSILKPRGVAIVAIIALFAFIATNVRAIEIEVKLVDATNQPIDWDNKLDIPFGEQTVHPPTFKALVSEGQALPLMGTWLIGCVDNKPVALSPDVKIEGNTLTVNVETVARSLRSVSGACWTNGRLYVAERVSFDGKNRWIWVFDENGKRVDHFEAVTHPGAIAVSSDTLFVIGDEGLASIDLKTHQQRFLKPLTYDSSVGQIALVKDRLYLGDKSENVVRILDAASGDAIGKWGGEGEEKLATPSAALSTIGVAATPGGTLIVSDASAVREFSIDGKFIRRIANVELAWRVAVGPKGEVALAIPSSKGDLNAMPQVYKFAADGAIEARFVVAAYGGPRSPDADKYRVRHLAGIVARQGVTGGLAFDPQGNLYFGDYCVGARDANQFWFDAPKADIDGGVVRISADHEITARWGTRFTPEFVKGRLAIRQARPPFARTSDAITHRHAILFGSCGDSISTTQDDIHFYGGASDAQHNWVQVLAQMLEARFDGTKVRGQNNGIGGLNAYEGLTRDPAINNWHQDLVFFQFGTNDTWFQHVTPQQYGDALRAAVTSIYLRTDVDLVLVTAGPLKEADPVKFREPPADYVKAALAVGEEMLVPVVNMTDAINAELAGRPFEMLHKGPTDPHPNDSGHEAWARIVLKTLAPALPPPVNPVPKP